MDPKPVRTYLDPDAVGPLPRAVIADDSDALAAARTIVRFPDSPTQELSTDDVLEVVDPNRVATSVAPVGFDAVLEAGPRRRLTGIVIGAVALSGVVLAFALGKSLAAAETASAVAVAAHAPPSPVDLAVAPVPALAALPAAPATPTSPAAPTAPAAPAAPASDPGSVSVGTLRVDTSAEGQRVYVDGVVLRASTAMLRCGPHEIAIGAPSRARTVDVPCGGEITVFR